MAAMTNFTSAYAANYVEAPSKAGQSEKYGRFFLYSLIITLICIEAALFRLDGRRINYPLVVSSFLLMIPHTINGVLSLRKLNTPTMVVLPLFAYVAFCMLSVTWSASPTETIFHSTVLGLGLVTTLGATRYSSEQTTKIFLTVCTVVFALSWLSLLLSPEYALQQKGYWRLRGVMDHEFELGFLASATLIILAIWWVSPGVNGLARRFGPKLYAMAAFAAITLFATQTRTLMVYTLFILLFIGVVYSKGVKRITVVVGGLVIMAGGTLFLNDILQAFSRGEGDATLSGRTTIWARTIALADHAPWTGYGFATFTDPRFDYIWYRYRPPHAHDTWIMAYFETGLIGAGILTLFLLGQLYVGFKISRRLKRPSIGLFLAILCTVSGVTSLIYGGKLAALIGVTFLLLMQEYSEAYPKKPKQGRSFGGRTIRATQVP